MRDFMLSPAKRATEIRNRNDSVRIIIKEFPMSAAIKPTTIEGTQLPNSRRIYIDGIQPGVRVPFRDIDQSPTRNFKNELEDNPPVRVYDTSGPYGDPSITCDVREGLSILRRDWIIARGDVEEYEGREVQPQDAPRTVTASRKCTTLDRASSHPKWNSSPFAKTSAAT